MLCETEFLEIGELKIEYLFSPSSKEREDFPALVFLHEGLGSVELWRNIPKLICEALGNPAYLIYSRPGYGRSTPVEGVRPYDYMHTEALDILPQVLAAAKITKPILVGHSDGASIALIHAGAGHSVEALVLIAPHVIVEEQSLAGIQAARQSYLSSDLSQRLARYHENPDATFWGWNAAWLSQEFATWNIEEYLPRIKVPTLVIQGDKDEYGTLEQLNLIEEKVAGAVELKVIPGARHSPHFEYTLEVVEAVAEFIAKQGIGNG